MHSLIESVELAVEKEAEEIRERRDRDEEAEELLKVQVSKTNETVADLETKSVKLGAILALN